MSVIRQRKAKLIKVTCICSIIVTILCIVLVSYLLILNHHYKKSLANSAYKSENITTVYQFTKDKKINDMIEKDDVKAVTLLKNNNTSLSNLNDIIGKRCKLDLCAGTIVQKDILYEGEKLEDDFRLHKYTYIKLTDKMKVGDYVDVRISFANGADFIVLAKKKVIDFSIYSSENSTENSIWFEVSEEDILRMSSAAVDAYNNGGASIYAIQYIEETQRSATSNYPVNDVVRDLIDSDPNIIKKAVNVLESKLRNEFNIKDYNENNLYEFDTNEQTTESEIVSGTDYKIGEQSYENEYENEDTLYNETISDNEIEYID